MPVLDGAFAILMAAVFTAAVARGMAGFGTGMIVGPIAGALYGPQTALVIIVVMDLLPMIPVSLPAMRIARWREIVPVGLGMMLLLPLGVYVLKHGDPVALRWVICVASLLCAAVLWSGVRYTGPRNALVSFGVGGTAGLLSGIASIPGPPVIIYWMASGLASSLVRANLLSLFFIGEFFSLANLYAADLMQRGPVMLGIAAIPINFIGLLVGQKLYGLASEATYRRVVFLLIVASALIALPAMDGLFNALFGIRR